MLEKAQSAPALSNCYTPEQWAQICSQFPAARSGDVLTQVCVAIEQATLLYRNRKQYAEGSPSRANDAAERKDALAWKKVLDLLRKLELALNKVKDPDRLLDGLSIIDADQGRWGFYELFIKRSDKYAGQSAFWQVVLHLNQNAAIRCRRLQLDRGPFARLPDQDVVRIFYYRDLFRIWTRDLGGHLTFGRDLYGEPSGPLIRFLRAVTGPAMREDAPSPETLVRAIKRERMLRARAFTRNGFNGEWNNRRSQW
jgi:hypothetical protein